MNALTITDFFQMNSLGKYQKNEAKDEKLFAMIFDLKM